MNENTIKGLLIAIGVYSFLNTITLFGLVSSFIEPALETGILRSIPELPNFVFLGALFLFSFFVLSILFLVSGIGLIIRKSWGRKISIFTYIVSIIFSIIFLSVTGYFAVSILIGNPSGMDGAFLMLGAFALLVFDFFLFLGLILDILIVIFLMKNYVKEYLEN